jgi:hypothetical protein
MSTTISDTALTFRIDPVQFATDATADYLLTTQPLPLTAFSPPVPSLVDLIKERQEAKEREKRKQAQVLADTEALFCRYSVRLLADLVEAGAALPGMLKYAGKPINHSGRFGITLIRHGNSAHDDTARVEMITSDCPYMVQFTHRKSGGHPYDLGSTHSHTSGQAFVRSYPSLLEDLATWIVGGGA